MSQKNKNNNILFWNFFSEISDVSKDIIFTYKSFIHWNYSKLLACIYSILVGAILALPSIVITIIVGFIDPIDWISVLSQESFLGQLQDINNVFWSLGVFLLSSISFLIFFLGFSYYHMFMLKLSLGYVDKKKLKRNKIFGFTRQHIFCFFRLSALNFIYIFSPVFLWLVIGTLGTYIFGYAFEDSIITKILLSFIYVFIAYVAYKTYFSFLIFAEEKASKNTQFSAIKYIKKSIEITKPKYFIKLIVIVFLYFVILLPFKNVDSILENQITDLNNTYNYRNDLFIDLSEADVQYLEFLSQDYESYSDNDIIDSVGNKYKLRIIHFLISYILFGGIILVIMSSFYRRILLKK